MRWVLWLSAAAAAVSASSLPTSRQVAFQAPEMSEPVDIVDMMAHEAHKKKIPLNAALEPVAPASHFRGSWTWTPCDYADAAVSVYSIETSPDPPVKGQNLTVRGVGDVHSEISVRGPTLTLRRARRSMCKCASDHCACFHKNLICVRHCARTTLPYNVRSPPATTT